MKSIQVTLHPLSALTGAAVLAAAMLLVGMQVSTTATRIPALSAEQLEILGHMSIVQLPDGAGGDCKTIRVSGVNWQVVNGAGSTATSNCVGNLIVGYNELGNPTGDERTGSHNVVVGRANTYTSYGGLVSAEENAVRGPYAAALGGSGNLASGTGASVTGGRYNTAAGSQSSVSGGEDNAAWGTFAAIAGGDNNIVTGPTATIAGGADNVAAGFLSSIGGGQGNSTSGSAASISGGASRTASGTHDWVAGNLFQDQ